MIKTTKKETPKYTLINKISMSCITDTQIYFQPTAQYLVVMLLYVSATSRSHLQGADVKNCCLCPPVRRTVYSPNISRQENQQLRMSSLLIPCLFSFFQHNPTLSHVYSYIRCDNTWCSYTISDIYGEIQRSFKWKAENLYEIRNVKWPMIILCV